MEFIIPAELYEFEHTFDPKDFAPGVWAGCEGMQFVIKEIDLENRKIKFGLLWPVPRISVD